MDVSAVSQVISNVGFPIAAYLLTWYTCNTTLKEVRDALNALTASLEEAKKE